MTMDMIGEMPSPMMAKADICVRVMAATATRRIMGLFIEEAAEAEMERSFGLR